MNDFIPALISLDQVPGEPFLIKCLQKQVIITMDNRTVRKGKFVLFGRSNYHIQFSLTNDKGNRENLEVPIPFDIEYHDEDNLMYFDYRLTSLRVEDLPMFEGKSPCGYFNKILEIQSF
jgi:hypothetical protein